jgi:hypothetical protein
MEKPEFSAGKTRNAKSLSLDLEGHGMRQKTLTELEQFDEDGHIKRTGKDLFLLQTLRPWGLKDTQGYPYMLWHRL